MINTTTTTRLRQMFQAHSARRELNRFPTLADSPTYIIGRIVNWTSIGANRWQYEFVRADIVSGPAFQERVNPNIGGWDGVAVNVIEGMNTGGFAGPGVSTTGLPGTFSLRPVQGYVMLFPTISNDGSRIWIFSVPNAIDGACTTPVTADVDYGTILSGSYLADDYGTFDAPENNADYQTFGVADGGTFAAPDFDYDFMTFTTGASADNYLFGSFN